MDYLEKIEEFKEVMLSMPWEDENFYKQWLAQTYFYVKHTEKILALCISHSEAPEDKRFKAHFKEEAGHEQLLLKDLKDLDSNIDKYSVLPATQSLFETQYYKVQRQGAAAHMGYAIFLEGIAATSGPAVCERLSKAFSSRGMKFMKVHAEEDQSHIAKAIDFVKDTPNKEDIELCFEQTEFLYTALLNQCRSMASQKNSTAAA